MNGNTARLHLHVYYATIAMLYLRVNIMWGLGHVRCQLYNRILLIFYFKHIPHVFL